MKGTIRKAVLLSSLSVALIGAPSVALANTTPGYHAVLSVATGDSHTIALRADRTLISWGANYFGQLGDGTDQSAPLPVNVYDPSGSFGSIKQVSARGQHSLALKEDGTVWEWGGVDHNPPFWEMTYDYQPRKVENLTDVVAISAGKNHALALKADGTVYAWGANAESQIGAFTMPFVTNPVKVTDLNDPTGFLTGVQAVAAGDSHSVILKTNGTVWAWGKNQHGQLGNGAEHDEYGTYYQPAIVPHPTQVVGVQDVKTIAAGGNHTLAVKQEGTVWTWGDNMYGQLGNGSDMLGPQSMAHQVVDLNDPTGYLTGVTAVAASTYHSLALKSDGTVRGFGNGGYGQAGYRDLSDLAMMYTANPFLDPSDPTRYFDDVVAISAGSSYSALVRADGSVWSAGNNYSGQLGDGTQESQQIQLVKAATVNENTAPVFVKAETVTIDWANGAVKDVFGNPVQGASSVAVLNKAQ